jgi:nitroreductase
MLSEDKIRKLMGLYYDWDSEREILNNIQKCQRNWDYSKFNIKNQVHREYVDELLWVAQNTPTKQHEGYFDIYWTADRNLIQEMSRYTWGNTHRREPPSNWRNSQSNASVYILWIAKEPNSQLNSNADGTLKDNKHHERWLNAYVSIGISLGLTARAAAKMGFATGFNKNHNDLNGDDFWENKLGILNEVNQGTKRITYGLGIGYPQENKERWESDETELMIGAANGSKITLTGQETHPRTNKKMRKAEIIDIRGKENQKIKDLYGNEHIVPEKVEFKINSFRKRGIDIIEIK